ncbi:MAG: asparagine synthase-related protein [Coxiellaceae bacterium]|nr:asparagine synthase-related protein [Coxiellaceae bacterium]
MLLNLTTNNLTSFQPIFLRDSLKHHIDYLTTSNFTICGDIYLFEKQELQNKLNIKKKQSDIHILALAYQKWQHDCIHHINGQFCFSVWDKKKHQLFLANDRAGKNTFYYTFYKQQFIFSTNINDIRQALPSVTVNGSLFTLYAIDCLSSDDTCYKQIKMLLPAHCMIIDAKQNLKTYEYWKLHDIKQKKQCLSRSEYYEYFQSIFTKAVNDCIDDTSPVVAHLSGGLDSSSVASIAARELKKDHKILYGYTANNKHTKTSYRNGWKTSATSWIHSVLDQYPNIKLHQHNSNPSYDIFEHLSQFYDIIDQPIRNVPNFDWILDCFNYANHIQSQTILTGTAGNATISWKGQTIQSTLKRAAYQWIHRKNRIPQSNHLNQSLFNNHDLQYAIIHRNSKMNQHHQTLNNKIATRRTSTIRPIQRYYNVKVLDPTNTLSVKTFCYNAPQWVFHKGKDTLNRRLLVREGLAGIVPETVRMNPYRGEQAADWYLQYNQHIEKWKHQLASLTPEAKEIIWSIYNEKHIFNIIKKHPKIQAVNHETQWNVRIKLMRCMSAAFFCDHICKLPNVSID